MITANGRSEYDWAPTQKVERYEQQTAYILSALGEISEDFKYSLITDFTSFDDLSLQRSFDPSKPLNNEELQVVSDYLGIQVSANNLIVDIAEEMFNKDLTFSLINDTL